MKIINSHTMSIDFFFKLRSQDNPISNRFFFFATSSTRTIGHLYTKEERGGGERGTGGRARRSKQSQPPLNEPKQSKARRNLSPYLTAHTKLNQNRILAVIY